MPLNQNSAFSQPYSNTPTLAAVAAVAANQQRLAAQQRNQGNIIIKYFYVFISVAQLQPIDLTTQTKPKPLQRSSSQNSLNNRKINNENMENENRRQEIHTLLADITRLLSLCNGFEYEARMRQIQIVLKSWNYTNINSFGINN